MGQAEIYEASGLRFAKDGAVTQHKKVHEAVCECTPSFCVQGSVVAQSHHVQGDQTRTSCD